MNFLRELLTPENEPGAEAGRASTLIAAVLLILILAAGVAYAAFI